MPGMAYTPEPNPARPPKGPGKGSKIAAGIISAIVAVLCAGIAIHVTSSPSTPPVATPSVTAPTGIADWRDGGGLDLINGMSADFGAIQNAASAADMSAVETACTKLQVDTEAAQAYRAIPDDQAQQHWARGLAYTARAASDCIAGTSSINPSLIQKSTTELIQATSEIGMAADRVRALAG